MRPPPDAKCDNVCQELQRLAPKGDSGDLISKDTAGIVGIEIGHHIAAFIFFSKHGKVRSVGADECSKADGCVAMVQKFGAEDKTILLHFEPSRKAEDQAEPEDEPSPEDSHPGAGGDHPSLPL